MKNMLLGIAVLLFAILFRLCSSGLESVSLIIGLTGLIITLTGVLNKGD